MHRFFTRRWKRGLTGGFHDRPCTVTREAQGRDAEPKAGAADSRSVKGTSTVEAATGGYGGGKETEGRKRHIVVDTPGLILAVLVTPASTGDRDAARDLAPGVHEGAGDENRTRVPGSGSCGAWGAR